MNSTYDTLAKIDYIKYEVLKDFFKNKDYIELLDFSSDKSHYMPFILDGVDWTLSIKVLDLTTYTIEFLEKMVNKVLNFKSNYRFSFNEIDKNLLERTSISLYCNEDNYHTVIISCFKEIPYMISRSEITLENLEDLRKLYYGN